MKKDEQPVVDVDVTDEHYAGPSAHVAALGTGVVKHYKWALMGMAGGSIFAMVFTKQTGKVMEAARTFAKGLKEDPEATTNVFAKFANEVKYTFGNFIHIIVGDEEMAATLRRASKDAGCAEAAASTASKANNSKTTAKTEEWFSNLAMNKEQGFGNWFVSHTFGIIPGVGKHVKKALRNATETEIGGVFKANDSKLTNALTFGGTVGFAGYVAGWAKALITGAQHGNQGKRQFERAQEQINSLKEDNADLNKINDDLHEKYVKASTRLDTIQAAQDNAARDAAERSEAPLTKELAAAQTPAPTTPEPVSMTPAPATNVQLDEHQHHGKLAEKELAVA